LGATLGGGVIAAIGLSATGLAGAAVAGLALALIMALRVQPAAQHGTQAPKAR
jgi:predicted MFS family arabinose efflux permease